ncbi:amino acid ABC transporter permease [Paracoccus yeei]|uniref:amino acid ABC transporter permease n=1 Tax=Paracoccus yeei TaxID=147645 RepID=UPI0028D6AF80|nr:amino acid ABC transporter permease [Paracoccus yeei]
MTMAVNQPRPAARLWLRHLRKSYFASPFSALLTMTCIGLMAWILWSLIDWAILSATFDPAARREECQAAGGACWSVIANRWRLILFGIYPYDEQWRSALAIVSVIVVIVLSCIPRFWTVGRISAIWGFGAATFYILMKGGILGLSQVGEEQWGGLCLTLFLFVATSVLGMPMAIGLALMRRSELPVVAKVTGLFIDAVRSLPLLAILFTAAVVLPFALPEVLIGQKLYRVIFGAALFFAAYQAEILRGGFQGVGSGQEEAAKALGVPYRHRIARILLPQAFRLALPATINQFVITFMETSLVVVVGFVELLAAGNAAYGTGDWKFAYVEVYVFISAIYFSFVFGLSRYGAYLERRMNIGRR